MFDAQILRFERMMLATLQLDESLFKNSLSFHYADPGPIYERLSNPKKGILRSLFPYMSPSLDACKCEENKSTQKILNATEPLSPNAKSQ